MPLPTDDLIVWASSDVNLPNLAGPNKVKPIDDLILKGWDFKQKPAADEFNYVLNNLGMHVSYLEESKTYTFSGDVTGTATSTGSEDVTFNVSVTDNSHNHISANISDATSSNVANTIVKRDAYGSISIGDLTVNKLSDTSTIVFPASGSDVGYIKHSETNDVSRMQFSISDNNDSIDKFEFGNTEGGSFVPRFTIDANGTTNVKSSVTATNFIGPLQGNALTATKVAASATGSGGLDLVTATIDDNDYFRIRCGSGGSDAGNVEIATADNGNEPIYVRQYTGQFVSPARTLTLLDAAGDTVIPGKLKITSAAGGVELGGSATGIYPGNSDGSSSTANNLKLASWFGIGFGPTGTDFPVPYGEYSHWFNTRNGDMGVRGTITAPQLNGNASTATTLQTARTISISGDGSGSVSFNGTSDISIPLVIADNSHNHISANISDATPNNVAGTILKRDGNGDVAARVFVGSLNGTASYASTATNNVSVLTGTISHGGTIPLPSGYSEGQCRWMVSMNNDNPSNTAWDWQEGVSSDHIHSYCSANGTRVVTCYRTVFNETGSQTHNGTANYIIIGYK